MVACNEKKGWRAAQVVRRLLINEVATFVAGFGLASQAHFGTVLQISLGCAIQMRLILNSMFLFMLRKVPDKWSLIQMSHGIHIHIYLCVCILIFICVCLQCMLTGYVELESSQKIYDKNNSYETYRFPYHDSVIRKQLFLSCL